MSVQSRTRATLVAMLALALLALLLLPALAAAVSYKTAATEGESFVIKSDGTLWSWGGNYNGDLGTGDRQPRSIPVQVGSAATWTSIVPYLGNGMIGLRSDGSLWRWGLPGSLTPTSLSGVSGWDKVWQQVAAGSGHVLLLTTSGELWAFGDNEWGELGDGTTTGTGPEPRHIGSEQWLSVAGGMDHSLGVRTDHSLWAWGRNDNGQLGQGDTAKHTSRTRIGAGTDWAAVFAGPNSSYALTTGGVLYAWGGNDYGQLGIGSKGTDQLTPKALAGSWADVAPGHLHCVALTTGGQLWGCGYNYDGELGLTPSDPVLSMTKIGAASTWSDVAAGVYHTVAATTAATGDKFAACGGNAYGQLGLGYSLYRPSPEQVGTIGGWTRVDASLTHAAGIRDDGSLWTWGYDINGALGGSGGLNAPARVGFDADWAAVSCGAYTEDNYTMALKTTGTLWAFGGNGTGQLGLGDKVARAVPTQVGSDADWKAVAASDGVGDRGRELYGQPFTLDDHTLAIKKDGSLWAWGANDYGQLGLGGAADRLAPTRVDMATDWATVACGDDYSAGLKTDGTLWVWGRNQFGQLGAVDLVGKDVPTKVTTGTGLDTFTAFACGAGRDGSHMLAVRTDGTLWGWGSNGTGELARGSAYPALILPPTQIVAGAGWKSVACGSYYGDNYSLATKTTGELWAWGGNYRGQLGNGDFVTIPHWPLGPSSTGWDEVVSGSDSFALKSDGTLWAWGDNAYGQLGLGDTLSYPSTSVYALQDYTDDVLAPAVSGTTTTAAAPKAVGVDARGTGGWSRTPRVITVNASDAGSGVGRPQISVTGGVSYRTGKSLTVRNGDVTIYLRAIDRVGNTSLPKYLGHWKIDTTKPKPAALAARVKRGATAKLKYRIADYSPCVVKIAVKNARRATVKSITVKSARPMTWLTASFRCKLAKGTYRWYVTATDSVGYKQSKAAVGKLVVK